MSEAFTLTTSPTGIGKLVFDLPGEKVNKLDVTLLEELSRQLDVVAANPQIKVLLITSGKEDLFIAGADLHQFQPLFKDPSGLDRVISTGHQVFNKLQKLSIPTIAVINGACLGGGLELALACTYRIVTDHPKTQLGLPETSLGIIPGWGGTQRLPRLVGLVEGLGMIVGGKPVNGVKAYKMHLADSIAAAAFLDTHAEQFANKILTKEGKRAVLARRKNTWGKTFLELSPVARLLVFPKVRKEILKKTKGHYPAPLVALDVIKDTYWCPLQVGLEGEKRAFLKVETLAPIAKQLIRLFFTTEALKKDPGAPAGTKTIPVKQAAVLGAGTMGAGITWLFANNDCHVRMKDLNWEFLGKGLGAIWDYFSQLIKIKKLKITEADRRLHNVTTTTNYSGFQNADLAIEAATENLELKLQLFAEVEKAVRPHTIIATNTSSLTIAEMESAFQKPERFVGMHFFNPVNRMPLVEVIAGKRSSPEAVATAVEVCKKMGKTAVVVQDCHGFLVNRIFVPSANEVMRLLEQGADFERLEKMMLDFGMPMSPFELADEVGNDVGYKVAATFAKAYGERMAYPALVKEMADRKLYGKKNKAGFYLYDGKTKKRNPAATRLFEKKKSSQEISDIDMRDRVFLLMINEAARCLEEKVVANPGYLDLALIMGIGFPPFRGGPLAYADTLGIPYIVDRLRHFEKTEGVRFAPSALLLQMANTHSTFYPD